MHGATDLGSYRAVGEQCAEDILAALRSVDEDPLSFKTVLDFGAGCGRTLRYLAPRLPGVRFVACDVDDRPTLAVVASGDDDAALRADLEAPPLRQGTRDKLAELTLLEPVVTRLGPSGTLHRVRDADHSFHVPARSGRNDREVMTEVLDALSAWIATCA